MDGLRGAAALCVLLLHLTSGRSGVLFPMAHFAVDLFFCLSGFVLAERYQARLDAGLSGGDFLRARFVRLYPMYALGLTLGIANALVALSLGAPAVGASQFIGLAFAAALLMPAFSQGLLGFNIVSPAVPYPFNFVSWSLFDELAVNVLFASFRPCGALRAAALAAALIGFIATTVGYGHPCGYLTDTFAAGLSRAVFGFFLGAALRDAYAAGWLKAPRLGALAPMMAATIALTQPWSVPTYLFCAVIVAPSIVAAATASPASARLSAVYGWLGRASYPLYALHYPAFGLFRIAYNAAVGAPYAEAPPLYVTLAFCAVLTPLCALISVAVERRMRRGLARAMDHVGSFPAAAIAVKLPLAES